MPDNLPQRKSPRLSDYDYSQEGAYFITICTHDRRALFGQVVDQEMALNAYGKVAGQYLQTIPEHFAFVKVDQYIVMPNHVHVIIVIFDHNEKYSPEGFQRPVGGSVSTIIRSYKSIVTREINRLRQTRGKIWQSRFHDHIIRNEGSLNKIREYVKYNPALWEKDTFYDGQ